MFRLILMVVLLLHDSWIPYVHCLNIEPSSEDITVTDIRDKSNTIKCTDDNTGVVWIIPKYTKTTYFTKTGNYRTSEITFDYKTGVDGAIVGYYYCLTQPLYAELGEPDEIKEEWFNILSEHDPNSIKRVYVFLENATRKLAPVVRDIIPTCWNRSFWLPCRPTSKSIKMAKLQDSFGEVKDYPMDPYHGIMFNITVDNGFDTYECYTNDDNDEDRISFQIVEATSPDKPVVSADNYGTVDENGSVTLKCLSNSEGGLSYTWSCPTNSTQKCDLEGKTLTLTNLQSGRDNGSYACIVQYRMNCTDIESSTLFTVNVLGRNQSQITFNSHPDPQPAENDELAIAISYSCFPAPTSVGWYNEQGLLLDNSSIGFSTINRDDNIMRKHELRFKSIAVSDAGTYVLRVTNAIESKEQTVSVSVQSKPVISLMTTSVTVKPNETVKIACNVIAFPRPTITWFYTACSNGNLSDCAVRTRLKNFSLDINEEKPYNVTYTLHFRTQFSGRIDCEAKNEVVARPVARTAVVYVTEMGKHLALDAPGSKQLDCFASKYKFTNEFKWFRNGTLLQRRHGLTSSNTTLAHMFKSSLHFDDFQTADHGDYHCEVKNTSDNWSRTSIYSIFNGAPIKFVAGMSTPITLKIPLKLSCEATGSPTPTIEWSENDEPLFNNSHVQIGEKELTVLNMTHSPAVGHFKCKASNFFSSLTITYTYDSTKSHRKNSYLSGYCAACASVVVIVWVIISQRKHSNRLRMKKLFVNGNGKQRNPLWSMSDQVDTLTYDRKYDFNESQLKLGMLLGKGRFSEVLHGEAFKIVDGEERTFVAVKRVKDATDEVAVKTLMDEVKIMVYLGNEHPNVVKMLGVTWKFYWKMEILVIREYCSHGSLLQYILRNRPYFIDQIDVQTRQINQQITSALDQHIGCSVLNQSIVKADRLVPSYTTTDLVCWSYQAAQGMRYLACKGVLHGDLCARNLLLTQDGFVRICNFELALNTGETNQCNNDHINQRWKAIELFNKHLYNTKSDIWSYGVMMWELFSLCEIPYDDIETSDLATFLESGKRLQCPKFATTEIYKIMAQCWLLNPFQRPKFETLAQKLSTFLDTDTLQKFRDKSQVLDEKSVGDKCLGGIEYGPNSPTVKQRIRKDIEFGCRRWSSKLSPVVQFRKTTV